MPAWLSKAAAALLALVASTQATSGPTVVLDIGHSHDRPGSVSPAGVPEYAYNRQLAVMLWEELASAGIEVVPSSPHSMHLPLTSRTRETERAALFVSIHHDSIQQSLIDQGMAEEYWGFSVFVSGKNPHWDKSVACARAVGMSMLQASEVPSLYHAMNLPGENRPFVDKSKGVHRYDDLVVLKTAKSPAILIEAGVIANPKEQYRLAKPEVARRLARAIAEGVQTCL